MLPHMTAITPRRMLSPRTQMTYPQPLLLLMGSERQGLSEEQQEACDLLVRCSTDGTTLLLTANRLSGRSWAENAVAMGLSTVAIEPLLVEVAATGHAVLFIDGLDRIAPEQQAVVTDLLGQILTSPALAEWRIVATARDAGIEPLRNWVPPALISGSGVGYVDVQDLSEDEAAAQSIEQQLGEGVPKGLDPGFDPAKPLTHFRVASWDEALDFAAAGLRAGQHMAEQLQGRGRVALLRLRPGLQSTGDRERGFRQGAEAGGLQVVLDAYVGDDSQLVQRTLNQQMARLDGLFTPNRLIDSAAAMKKPTLTLTKL